MRASVKKMAAVREDERGAGSDVGITRVDQRIRARGAVSRKMIAA